MSKIRYASFSETGLRTNNEDFIQISCDPDNDRYLFVCCDGMGGHAMGEVASQVVSLLYASIGNKHLSKMA